MCFRSAGVLVALAGAASLTAQDADQPEKWNLYFQATSIGQYHDAIRSPYQSSLSLAAHAEAEASLTSTLFWGLRLGRNTRFYFNPEIAGGRGFSGTDGIANFPNGEMPRVSTATPKPYIARAYLTQDFAFSDERETISSDANQLAGSRPATRYSVTVGRFTVTDFFDNNRYTHDPRTQFMGWAIMYNGAWDYPADTRGYTWGWLHEFHTRRWSLRYASAAEPRTANGPRFDRRVFQDRGDMFEGEVDVAPGGHAGAIRALSYINHSRAGTYADAIHRAETTGGTPDIYATSRPGTLKYGFGLNVEQEVRKDIGVFGRLGWNDGKTQSFAFAVIDRLASGGISIDGARWKRSSDTVAAALTVTGLSGVHALYLTRGGLDFMIGDGGLNYAPEYTFETYYKARVADGVYASVDLQHITNPAYNRDRGPVWVGSLRLHLEWGKGWR
ncbi:MAG TPA: carbohydrate porin [Bryobacteraceae bacterium]|nr:carbohydrate porin [Bryobacteraceae bacterium]